MSVHQWYITFGQRYRREAHPTLPPGVGTPDGYVLVRAPNEAQARDLAAAVTTPPGGTTPLYAFLSPYPGPDERAELEDIDGWYPLGPTGRVTRAGGLIRLHYYDAEGGASARTYPPAIDQRRDHQ